MLLAVLMLPAQRWTAHISGRILDREGKPLVNAQITYKQVGQYSDGGAMKTGDLNGPDPLAGRITDAGTSRVYKVKTDNKGEFDLIGVAFGVYAIEIFDSSGKRVYSTKRLVGDNTDSRISNTLNVDVSAAVPGPGGVNLAADAMNKEQLRLVRQENASADKLNRLIAELHSALLAQDWNQSAELLQQLLALDPNRWEFYQNLGAVQNNLGHYQEAVQAFQKGLAIAEKTLANAPDQKQARTDMSGMMIAEGDAYLRLDKLEPAVALYTQAAAMAPSPGMAWLRACNAQANRGAAAAAIDVCNRAIAADPDRWDSYQILGGIENTSGKSTDALATFERGVQAARKELAADPGSVRTRNGMGQMLNAEGDLYAKAKRYDEATAAFAESAKLSAYAALPYFNLCATYFNLNRLPDAVAACDQAIASDPSMADAYYIKACALFGKGSADEGRASVPETRAALNKYLEFAPFGRFAQDARHMLDKLDSADDAGAKTRKPASK
jgi:tetratricopeptide (TPR) repeat protein